MGFFVAVVHPIKRRQANHESPDRTNTSTSMITSTTTNIQPRGTLERASASLDARSAVALEWVTFYCARHGSVKVAPAVVIRRALELLAEHCSNLDGQEVAREMRAFVDAGRGEGTARSLTEARARIEDHIRAPAAQPMAHWLDALQPKEDRLASAALLAKLESVLASIS